MFPTASADVAKGGPLAGVESSNPVAPLGLVESETVGTMDERAPSVPRRLARYASYSARVLLRLKVSLARVRTSVIFSRKGAKGW